MVNYKAGYWVTRMSRTGIWFLWLLLAACSAQTDQPLARPQEGTGLAVAAPFVPFYQAHGGARVFGYPITELFQPTAEARPTQYFQMLRLELDATQPAEMQVLVYPLGQWALEAVTEPEVAPGADNGRAQFFPETGQSVQDEFLTFYETYQGEQLFGPPISPQLNEGGLRVQYFRNARLEWRPELPVTDRVQVSRLAQAHFDTVMVLQYQNHVSARPVDSAGVTAAEISASVQFSVLYAGDVQTIFATVLTPDGRPVSHIRLEAVLVYDGQTAVLDLGYTDDAGQLSYTLPLNVIPPGLQVQVTLQAYNGSGQLIGTQTLGFQTWW